MVTIKDVAEAAGVSYATVSRALNGRDGVNHETRQKVLDAAKRMGYQPNGIARSLVKRQSYTIALIVPDISNPFFAEIALAVNESAMDKGYTMLLCNTNWDPKTEMRQLAMVQEKRVDGIILKPSDEKRSRFEDITTPLVLLSYIYEGNLSYIEVENDKGGFMACEHLIKCGYKRIAFIGGKKMSLSNRVRMEGYKRALKHYKMPIDESLVQNGDFTVASGYQTAKRLLDGSESPPDAIFCGNDLIALGVWQCATELGRNVPDELGIVGFDDVYLASLPQTQLTTVAQPRKQMGDLAASMIITAIEAAQPYAQKIMLQPELVVRRSTRSIDSKIIAGKL